MKRFKLKGLDSGLLIFVILIYLEFLFRLLVKSQIFNISILYVLLYSIFLSLIINIITKFFKLSVNKTIWFVVLFMISLLYSVQLCMYKMFGFYFNWSLIGATDQVAAFMGDGIKLILNNVLGIVLIFMPFILTIIFRKKISFDQDIRTNSLYKLGYAIGIILVFLGCLFIDKNSVNSSYELYYKVNNSTLNINRFGVINAFLIDSKRSILGFDELVNVIIPSEEDPKEPNETIYQYNNLDIDFDKLIANENNETVKNMHEYFKNQKGTKQNEYTNYFEGKNLILFMAESFNEIAVREDITPTLYKLVNSGFVFDKFYTPTISSTIGGEFQELTGLVATDGFLSPWRSGNNAYPLGIANLFKGMGYNTFAYHDHNYTFQNRNKYLSALGFENFKGCRNGLEKDINCKIWPESDVEMIEATYKDFINSEEPFFTYYVTVSGHGDYGFSYSAMAKKHKKEVEHLNYSEKPLAYLAAQIELNNAIELLIEKLEEAGKLDDTVIALVGDHYPYYLTNKEVNEIASYQKDNVVEINHSNFILWNNNMDTIKVEKVGSQIDVLPTIYNLFGVKYDSRLIIGKDILSTEPGLAIFGNRSWVSDKGTYFASQNKFVSSTNEEVSNDYIKYMNALVANKVTMSKNIMKNDYYRKVLGD